MMMMEEQDDSRRISSSNNNTDSVVDTIRSLPDCILGFILSFLPTKQAAATSLLSKRWKFSWLDAHTLDFTFHGFADNISFIRVVDEALRLTDGRSLNKFRLLWHISISSHVICWIDAAIRRNVCDIFLYLGVGDQLKLPITGFNCNSLQSLHVTNIFLDNDDTTMVLLPRLETLNLGRVRFTSKEAFQKLINGCPLLHSLKLTVYSSIHDEPDDAVEDFMYIVSSPSLRRLDMFVRDRCTLKLNAPSLEYLRLTGCISEIFAENISSSLIEAYFDIKLKENGFPHNSIVEAVRVIEHAKFLNLSALVMQALSRATFSLSTKFKRLVKLVVGPYCCSVQAFILNSENLEDLIICQDYWQIDTSNPPDHSRWTAPAVVPRCFSKSLKKVRLYGFKCLEDEREMIRYMLENGVALEILLIHCISKEDGEQLELLQEICEFPRKSPVCKVQFDVMPKKRKFQLL